MIRHYTYPMKNTKKNMAAESISKSMVERPYIRILTKSAGGEEEQRRHIQQSQILQSV